MKKVLVTGGNGQLGRELRGICGSFADLNMTFTDLPELDLTDDIHLLKFLTERRFHYLINCAAYTAVDKAESDITQAKLINSRVPASLAELASRLNFKLIHISTDYVYNGNYSRPLLETDKTMPSSVYGITKLEGENGIMRTSADAVIIRTSWLYSMFGHNFVKTIIRLSKERDEIRVVNDQVGTPTWAYDLANCILHIISNFEIKERQIYNYSNEGQCSWFEFARTITELTKSSCKVIPVSSAEYPQAAPRPAYCVLDKTKIKAAFGIIIPHWKDSLIRCLTQMETLR